MSFSNLGFPASFAGRSPQPLSRESFTNHHAAQSTPEDMDVDTEPDRAAAEISQHLLELKRREQALMKKLQSGRAQLNRKRTNLEKLQKQKKERVQKERARAQQRQSQPPPPPGRAKRRESAPTQSQLEQEERDREVALQLQRREFQAEDGDSVHSHHRMRLSARLASSFDNPTRRRDRLDDVAEMLGSPEHRDRFDAFRVYFDRDNSEATPHVRRIGRRGYIPLRFIGSPLMRFGPNIDLDNMDHDEILRLQEMIGHVKKGATAEQISTLPTDQYHVPQNGQNVDDENDDKRKCCICLDQFEEGEEIRRLPCLHIFHSDEIAKWLQNSNKCPICRIPINADGPGDDVSQLLDQN